jgi:hypothetical protein
LEGCKMMGGLNRHHLDSGDEACDAAGTLPEMSPMAGQGRGREKTLTVDDRVKGSGGLPQTDNQGKQLHNLPTNGLGDVYGGHQHYTPKNMDYNI